MNKLRSRLSKIIFPFLCLLFINAHSEEIEIETRDFYNKLDEKVLVKILSDTFLKNGENVFTISGSDDSIRYFLDKISETTKNKKSLINKFKKKVLKKPTSVAAPQHILLLRFICFGGISNNTLKSLVNSPFFINLERLSLQLNNLDFTSVEILSSPQSQLKSLIHLDLAGNQIGDNGLMHLIYSPLVKSLLSLNLAATGITDVGAEVLAKSSSLGKLLYLNLSWNKITEHGGRVLLKTKKLHHLVSLNLLGNDINKGSTFQSSISLARPWIDVILERPKQPE